VFLLAPVADLQLDGLSMRSACKAEGKEYLFKLLDRVMKPTAAPSQERQPRWLNAMLSSLPAGNAVGDVLKRASAGDEAARAEIDGMGLWLCWRAGLGQSVRPHLRIAVDHAVEVEQASLEALRCLTEGAYGQAADAVAANPTIRCYANDVALARLSGAESQLAALPARAACLCEFLLSQVARVEVRISPARPAVSNAAFGALLAGDPVKRCNPGGVLIRSIQEWFGATSLEGFLKLNAGSRAPAVIDESTLKRWSSGAVFPSSDKVGHLIRSVLQATQAPAAEGQAVLDYFGEQYWAARRLQKLLEIARQLHRSAPASFGWQEMLGDTTPDAWCRRRYPSWVAHWNGQARAC
jgi:hypothetical protein